MRLPEYIKLHGIEYCADKFLVSQRKILTWLYEQRSPRPLDALQIVDATEGEITFWDIYTR